MSFDDQHRDHPNDRRVGFIDIGNRSAVTNFKTKIDIVAQFFFDDVSRFVGSAVIFNQSLANFLRAAADQFELALKQEAQAVDRVDVERIADRDYETGFTERDRDHFETTRVFSPDLLDNFRRNHYR